MAPHLEDWEVRIRNTEEDFTEWGNVPEDKLSSWYVVLHHHVFLRLKCYTPYYAALSQSQATVLWSDEDLSLNHLSSRHTSFMCDKRIFLLWKGRGFSFLWGSSWAEPKKRIWQRQRKKVSEGEKKNSKRHILLNVDSSLVQILTILSLACMIIKKQQKDRSSKWDWTD